MTSPPPFQAEDQTDEDFFEKLVGDGFSIEGSRSGSRDMVRDFSNLSLGDGGASLEDSSEAGFAAENKDQHQSLTSPSSEASKKELLVTELSAPFESSRDQVLQSGGPAVNTMEAESQVPSKSESGGSKGASVKEVQWSAFSANLQQVDNGGFEPYSDFFTECADATVDKMKDDVDPSFGFVENPSENPMTYVNSSEVQDTKSYDLDGKSAECLESYYPGWKYDAGTGQWYQVDGYDASTSPQLGSCNAAAMDSQESLKEKAQVASLSISGSSDIVYQQQNTQSVLDTVDKDRTLTSVSNWNLDSQGSAVYPPNMVFDAQYPGWYYDTNTQQWYTLESYNRSLLMTSSMVQNQVIQDATSSAGQSEEKLRLQDGEALSEQNFIQGQDNQGLGGNWNASTSNYAQQNMWQPEQVGKSRQVEGFSENQVTSSFYGSLLHGGSYAHQQTILETFEPVTNHNLGSNNVATSHSFLPGESMHCLDQPKVDQSVHANLSTLYYGNQNSVNNSQQPFHGADISYSHFTPHEGRSSIGRPAHALVTFGFGGKLVIMKDTSFFGTNLDHGNQGTVGAAISILSLSEVVKDNFNASSIGSGSSLDYFHALCEQSFPGPLVGGNAATKDINKWIDERIISCEYPGMDFHRGKLLRLLLSLLKISFQHYGKLRSPFGSDLSIEDINGPEMAVTKLFASAKKNSAYFGEYGSFTQCMQNLPSDGKIQETALEVQNLLVSGRRKEALQCAQEGQLWGPALVLAAQLGDKFYVDTVKKMAHRVFIPGSPLRTLSLLIAGQPADVFSMHSLTSSLSGGIAAPQQPSQTQSISMLDDWEENLAIITANRTKDDELVIIHLGDCLWKEKGEVTAAHTCYLVAETNFEQYSDSARLCLIGADHWKYPRTYASPDAIQRTEIYEYSKVLGNSQFVLLPFQPYKLIYAYMLAEVGKVSVSLRYCQASLKILKNSGRTPEVEMWRSLLSSLEEQLRTHQQSGYSTNLAAAKLVGKLFTSIDSTIHRMIGASPPSLPPMPQSSVNDKEMYSAAPKLANSHSTMNMSSLVPSASVETMSEWVGDSSRKIMHNRSISEPDFGRSPHQDSGSDGARGKESISSGSRFGRIGSQLLQKTMGWVSRSHRQAKLGERNKFYYDEKLKRWVEEGAKLPAEETPLKPPPQVASFQNGVPDYNITTAFKRGSPTTTEGTAVKSSVPSSGKPPVPPSQNQFSARGRMGVRSRYVDTFNKGGGAVSNSFQSPAIASVKPPAGAKFFVPLTPATPDEQKTCTIGENNQQATNHAEMSTAVPNDASLSSPSSSSTPSIHRFPSMDDIAPSGNKGPRAVPCSENGPLSLTRRTSWSGTYTDVSNPQITQINLIDDGHRRTTYIPNGTSNAGSISSSPLLNDGSCADDLHEVEL